MNRAELQSLSTLRLREARLLLAAGECSGAYYLAGYAVECALKACIAKSTAAFDFPDKDRVFKSYSHKPEELLKVASLNVELERDRQVNPGLEASWGIVNKWSEQSRYTVWSEADARAMLDAIDHPQDGLLQWIVQRW